PLSASDARRGLSGAAVVPVRSEPSQPVVVPTRPIRLPPPDEIVPSTSRSPTVPATMVLRKVIAVADWLRTPAPLDALWPMLPLTVHFVSDPVPATLNPPAALNPPAEVFPTMVLLINVVVPLRLNTPPPPLALPASRELPLTVQLVRLAVAFWLPKP